MFGEQLHVGEQRHNQPCDIFVIIEIRRFERKS